MGMPGLCSKLSCRFVKCDQDDPGAWQAGLMKHSRPPIPGRKEAPDVDSSPTIGPCAGVSCIMYEHVAIVPCCGPPRAGLGRAR